MNRTERRTLLVAFAAVLLPLAVLPVGVSTASPGAVGGVLGSADGPQSVEPGTVLQARPPAHSPAPADARSRSVARPRPPCRTGSIALTFDDGPTPVSTSRLVRVLLQERVPATFFMNGAKVRRSPHTVRYVDRSGFTIGNHTWSHPELPRLSGRQIRGQVLRTGAELRRLGVDTGPLMRPPYGAINARVAREVRSVGLVPVLWTVDSRDWSGGSARQIARRILAQLRPYQKNIVLQHDGVENSPASVSAVRIVIRAARARGYCFSDLGPRGGVAPYRSVVPPGTPVAPQTASRVPPGSASAGWSPVPTRSADPTLGARQVGTWTPLPPWAFAGSRDRPQP